MRKEKNIYFKVILIFLLILIIITTLYADEEDWRENWIQEDWTVVPIDVVRNAVIYQLDSKFPEYSIDKCILIPIYDLNGNIFEYIFIVDIKDNKVDTFDELLDELKLKTEKIEKKFRELFEVKNYFKVNPSDDTLKKKLNYMVDELHDLREELNMNLATNFISGSIVPFYEEDPGLGGFGRGIGGPIITYWKTYNYVENKYYGKEIEFLSYVVAETKDNEPYHLFLKYKIDNDIVFVPSTDFKQDECNIYYIDDLINIVRKIGYWSSKERIERNVEQWKKFQNDDNSELNMIPSPGYWKYEVIYTEWASYEVPDFDVDYTISYSAGCGYAAASNVFAFQAGRYYLDKSDEQIFFDNSSCPHDDPYEPRDCNPWTNWWDISDWDDAFQEQEYGAQFQLHMYDYSQDNYHHVHEIKFMMDNFDYYHDDPEDWFDQWEFTCHYWGEDLHSWWDSIKNKYTSKWISVGTYIPELWKMSSYS